MMRKVQNATHMQRVRKMGFYAFLAILGILFSSGTVQADARGSEVVAKLQKKICGSRDAFRSLCQATLLARDGPASRSKRQIAGSAARSISNGFGCTGSGERWQNRVALRAGQCPGAD